MNKMWLDDCRPAPKGWHWVKSVHEAKIHCCQTLNKDKILNYDVISFDHDAGDYAWNGGDYIEFLKWLEEKAFTAGWKINQINFHLHSMNPVGVQNMRAIIRRNGWKEVF